MMLRTITLVKTESNTEHDVISLFKEIQPKTTYISLFSANSAKTLRLKEIRFDYEIMSHQCFLSENLSSKYLLNQSLNHLNEIKNHNFSNQLVRYLPTKQREYQDFQSTQIMVSKIEKHRRISQNSLSPLADNKVKRFSIRIKKIITSNLQLSNLGRSKQ